MSGRPARSWLAGAVEAAVKEKKKGKPAGREERKMVSGGGKRKSKPRGEGAMSLCLQNRGWRREVAVGEEKISGVWAVVEGKWVLMCRTWGWLWVAAREEG